MATEKIRISYEVDKKQLDASNKALEDTAKLNNLTQKEVDQTTEKYKDQEKTLSKNNKELSSLGDNLEDVGKGSKKAQDGVNTLTKATGKFGGALKLLGIGLIIAAFAKFTEALMANQRVADFLTKATKTLGIAFNDLVNFILDSGSTITKLFNDVKEGLNAAFNDPLATLKKFGEAVKANITERFNSLIDTIGFVGKAIKQVFEGDFKGAMESAKQAAKEFVDVTTGVPNSVDKITDAVTKGASSIFDYAKATYASADALVELEKSGQLAEIQQQRLIQQNERAAEIQRQIRDDVSKTFAVRKEANDKIFLILDKQEKLEKEQLSGRLKAADLLLQQDQHSLEAQLAKQQILLETDDLENRLEGLRSEAIVNRVALIQEESDKLRESAVIKAEIALAEAETADEAVAAIIDRRQLLLENLLLSEGERALIISESEATILAIKKTAIEEEVNAKKKGLDAIKGLLLKGFENTKAGALFEIGLNTHKAALSAYQAIVGIPVVGPALAPIAAGVATGFGLRAAGKVTGIQPPKFEQGGKIGGNLHSGGGTLIEAERDEFVMSRKATSKYGFDFMDKINNLELNDITSGTKAATVNVIDTKQIAEQLKNMPQNIMNVDSEGFALHQRRGHNITSQKLTRYST